MAESTYRVTYGGWFQRTTLHLSEVYDLFVRGGSHLEALDKAELKRLHKKLDLESATREQGYLEYMKAVTKTGIEVRYYEDGLYVLSKAGENVVTVRDELEKYFAEKMNPAVSYIFSLGAPTPKILANIHTVHPVAISVFGAEHFVPEAKDFGEVYTSVTSGKFTVAKTPQYIFISAPEDSEELRALIEMQIFFREFKDQLEKYLTIHRTIWEEISEVKEAKQIRGKDVEEIRGRLDGYQKTISLISNRINQMGSYNSTRSSLAGRLNVEKDLVTLFEYKFETLADTLSYIKEIWKMTADYLSSAIQNLVEIKSQSASNNLKSLQTITSIGVISGVLGYLSADKLPHVSRSGAIYFVALFALTWLMNFVILEKYKYKKYSLRFGDRASDL